MSIIDRVVISVLGDDRRALAFDEDGRLAAVVIDPPGGGRRAGDVVLGRITAAVPQLPGYFVAVGEAAPGLLMAADVPTGRALSEGDAVAVRVLRASEAGKGARLSMKALPDPFAAPPPGAQPPLTLAAVDPIAALLRQAGDGLAEVVCDDAATLASLRAAHPDLAQRLRLHPGRPPLLATDEAAGALAEALAPTLTLPSGGRVHIAETAALVAIDVDLGGTAGGPAAAALTANREAMAAIGRQIGLRDLAGLIVIDPVPLRDAAARAAMLAALQAALPKEDRTVRVAGFTRLGLIELSRQRLGPSLARQWGEPCEACDGSGVRPAARVAAGDILRALLADDRALATPRPTLVVAPAIAAALAGTMQNARQAAEARLGRGLAIAADPSLSPGAWHIV